MIALVQFSKSIQIEYLWVNLPTENHFWSLQVQTRCNILALEHIFIVRVGLSDLSAE